MSAASRTIIRLSPPLSLSSLPRHPYLQDDSPQSQKDIKNNRKEEEEEEETSPEDLSLKSFLKTALTEAQTFLEKTLPENFFPDNNTNNTSQRTKRSCPSTAAVQLSTATLSTTAAATTTTKNKNQPDSEFWVCRRSLHADAATPGTASWDEFVNGLRVNHSENEMAYTPSVTGFERLLEWPVVEELVTYDDAEYGGEEGGRTNNGRRGKERKWKEVGVYVNLITHTFHPRILISPRSFFTLLISAFQLKPQEQEKQPEQFITIQIPIAFERSENINIPGTLREKISSCIPKDAVLGTYASIESVSLTPSGERTHDETVTERKGQETGQIEWLMATTSEAGGLIPPWVQRSWTMGGVPRAVVADVGLFMRWVDEKRRRA